MKILQENAGLLTNSEVLSVLRDREADQEPVVSKALISEIKVYAALKKLETAPVTREQQQACIDALKQYNLTKEETLQLLNHAPSDPLTTYLCVHQAVDTRRVSEDQIEEIVAVVQQNLAQ